eukprot:310732-Pyramimonas_sp.AAC.1
MKPRCEAGTTLAATAAVAAFMVLLMIFMDALRSPRTRTFDGSRWQPQCSKSSGSPPLGKKAWTAALHSSGGMPPLSM